MEREVIVILLDSSQLGGIESHVYHLARALKKHGYSAEIWFYKRYSKAHPLSPRLDCENIRYRYLNGSFRDAFSQIKCNPPRLLHTHGYKAGVMGRIAARLFNVPVVSTFHNGDPGEGVVRIYTWLDRLTSAFSENIAVSNEIADRFKNKPVQINNFINLPGRQVKSGNHLAFVGRLSHEKGPDQYLQLAKHIPDQVFRVYGSGPMESLLQEQEVSNIQFMGQVSGMNDQWQYVDLLCITSRHEGLPMVALEAMANGVPVVSFALGALPDLIEQGVNGWIAPQGDIQEMSKLITLWFSLPEAVKSEVRKACRQTIAKSYSYKAVLPQVLNVYARASERIGKPWSLSQPSVNSTTEIETTGD